MSWNTCLLFLILKFCFGCQARIGRGGMVVALSMKVFCGGLDTDCVPSTVRMPAVQLGVVGLMSLDSEMDVRI